MENMISCFRDDRNHLKGWLHDGENDAPLSYITYKKYEPVAFAELPDGDLLALERRSSKKKGVAARLCVIERHQVAPGAVLTCRAIATIEPPMSVDNFEAMAIRRTDSGETHVYLLSDDNGNPAQRTLLLMFKLDRELARHD